MKKNFCIIFFSLTVILSSNALFAQADVQASAINLISDFAGEEIVLQSSDYFFDTKFGKVKVKLSKSDGKTNANLTLTPPLEGETGKMSEQASALVSALSNSVESNNNQAVMEAISAVLQNGVGETAGAEGDVSLDISLNAGDNNSTDVSLDFKGDDTSVNAKFNVSQNNDGTAKAEGKTESSDGSSANINLNISTDGNNSSATGTIGNNQVQTNNASNSVFTKLEEASITNTSKDGTSQTTTYQNNSDGTSTKTEISKDSQGNVTSQETTQSQTHVTTGKGNSANSSSNAGQNSSSSGSSNASSSVGSGFGSGTSSSGGNIVDNSLLGNTPSEYSKQDISGQDFSNRDLKNREFKETIAVGTNFENALLSNADFTSANLTNANLKNTDLASSNLSNTKLDGVTITNANLSNTVANGLTKEQFYTTADYQSGAISGTNLSNNNLTGWDFRNLSLSNVSFANANAEVLQFAGATINNVDMSGISVKALANFNENAVINGLNLDNSTFTDPSFYGGYRLAFSTSTIDNLSMRNANINLDAIPTTGNNGVASAIYFTGSTINSADFTGSTITGNITGNLEDSMYAFGISAKESTISTLNLNSTKISANSENENSSALAIGIVATTSTISTLNLNSTKISANSENENSSATAVGITVRDATIDNNGDGLIAENAEMQITATSKNGTAEATGFNGTNLTANDSAVIDLDGLKANVEANAKRTSAIAKVINLQNASIDGSISAENIDITATATANRNSAAYGVYAPATKVSESLSIKGSNIITTAIASNGGSTNGTSGFGIYLLDADLKNAIIDVENIETFARSLDPVTVNGVNTVGAKVSESLSIKGSTITTTATSSAKVEGKGINLNGVELKNTIIDVENIETSATSIDGIINIFSVYAGSAKVSESLTIKGLAITTTASSSGSAYGYGIGLDITNLQNVTIDVGTIETSAISTVPDVHAYGVSVGDAECGNLSIKGSTIKTTISSDANANAVGTAFAINLFGTNFRNVTIDVENIESSITLPGGAANIIDAIGVNLEYAKVSESLSIKGSTISTTVSSNDEYVHGYGINLPCGEFQNVIIDVDTIETSAGSSVGVSVGFAKVTGNLIIKGSTIKTTASSLGDGINLAASELQNATIDVGNIEASAISTGSGGIAYGVNLAEATVNGNLSISGSIISTATQNSSGINFNSAKINGDVKLSLEVNSSVSGVGKAYGADFNSAVIGNNLDVRASKFIADVTTDKFGNMYAYGAYFTKEIGSNALFNDSQFSATATRNPTNSYGNVDTATAIALQLYNTGINSSFKNTTFTASSSSEKTDNTAKALYVSSTINKGTDFSGAKFTATSTRGDGDVSTLYGYTYGIEAKNIEDDVSFKNITISVESNDAKTHINSGEHNVYTIGGNFTNGTIGSNVDFSGSEFNVDASGGVDITGSRIGGLRMNSSTIGDNLNLSNIDINVNFDSADVIYHAPFAIDLSGSTIGNSVDFSNSHFSTTMKHSGTSTAQNSYGIYGIILENATVGNNANFQNSQFSVSLNGTDKTSTNAIRFSDTTLINGADFRGSNVSNENLAQATAGKNIIRSDGSIQNFSMKSSSDNWILRAHEPVENAYPISAKITLADATISNSTLTISENAELEVLNGKSLSLGENGIIELNINPYSDSVPLYFSENASFDIGLGKIIINLTEDVEDYCLRSIINWSYDCDMASLSDLVKSENIILNLDGSSYTGAWDIILGSNSLDIKIGEIMMSMMSLRSNININTSQIPEPSTYAFIFGILSTIIVVVNRRRNK